MNADGSHLPKQRTLYDYDGNDQLLETKNTTTAANVLTEEEHEEWDVTIALGRDSDGDGIKDYDEGKPWYTATAPTFSTEDNRKTPVDAGGNPDPMMLSELIGADFNDSRWDILLDQLTVDELVEMMTYGGFKSNAIPFNNCAGFSVHGFPVTGFSVTGFSVCGFSASGKTVCGFSYISKTMLLIRPFSSRD